MRSVSANETVLLEEGGLSNTPLLGPAEPRTSNRIWILQNRIDWITIAFQLRVFEKTVDNLYRSAAEIRPQGTSLEHKGIKISVKALRTPGKLVWENADARGIFDIKANGGWVFEVTPKSEYLCVHSTEEAIRCAEDIGGLFGYPLARRLRRIDLCADIGDWPIASVEAKAWIIRSKGRIDDFRSVTHYTGPKVTGFTICPGNPLMMRAYDKVTELSLPGREHKREIEHAIWRDGGWTDEPVTRIEFQLRGSVLDQFRLRDPVKILEKIDSIWGYATKKWVRLSIPNSASRRKRWQLDPRWELVRSVIFDTASPLAERLNGTNGPSLELVIGVVRNYLASNNGIENIDDALSNPENADKVDRESAKSKIITLIHDYSVKFEKSICESIFAKYGPRNALARLTRQHNFAVAKFSQPDPIEFHLKKGKQNEI